MRTRYYGPIALAALATGVGLRAADLKPIQLQKVAEDLPATSDAGPIRLPMRELLLEGRQGNGKLARGTLAVIFDPSTKLFVWEYVATTPDNSTLGLPAGIESGYMAIYSGNERLVMFRAQYVQLTIEIREATERAESADDAETKAIKRAGERLEMEGYYYNYGLRKVSLFKELGSAFVAKPLEVTATPAKLIAISRRNQEWEIILEDQWKERITLNDKFELISLKRED